MRNISRSLLALSVFVSGGRWRAPFAVLVVGLLVAGGSAYRGYVKLRKSHLL